MEKQKTGKIIFSKVLEMPLEKYLTYMSKISNYLDNPVILSEKIKLSYARIAINNEILYFKVLDKRLEHTYPLQNSADNKTVCSLKWINTRNKFSSHILKSFLNYQKIYWISGKDTDLKPLTLKQFLSLYPLQYLDQSRLSRLISNLAVINPQNKNINLKYLFLSKKNIAHILLKRSSMVLKML